ncbi:conserved hypothetical protein; putative transcriptional regulatory protein HTH type [Agrobacterium sp. NCPPB 925]|nr:conserved hypothetical protein; putative transcriptional regulatory protein HTH type [Agrobacterium sp. NCPPB 925]
MTNLKAQKKQPNAIDVHVGGRIRLRRKLSGMSQERLGEALGITFQQIQKYENGTNRVGASRLQNIANVLNVPISFFFEDAPGTEGDAIDNLKTFSSLADGLFLASTEGLHLNQAFLKIRNPDIRRKIVELVTALAEQDKK